jgi:hypothetical protein
VCASPWGLQTSSTCGGRPLGTRPRTWTTVRKRRRSAPGSPNQLGVDPSGVPTSWESTPPGVPTSWEWPSGSPNQLGVAPPGVPTSWESTPRDYQPVGSRPLETTNQLGVDPQGVPTSWESTPRESQPVGSGPPGVPTWLEVTIGPWGDCSRKCPFSQVPRTWHAVCLRPWRRREERASRLFHGSGGGGASGWDDGHVARALVHLATAVLASLLIDRERRPATALEGNLPLERTSPLRIRPGLSWQRLGRRVRGHHLWDEGRRRVHPGRRRRGLPEPLRTNLCLLSRSGRCL